MSIEGRTIKQYYSSMKHLSRVYDQRARQNPAPTECPECLRDWQVQARRQLCELLGLDHMASCASEPEVYETHETAAEYYIERVRITTAPGLCVPLIVLVPKGISPGEKRAVWLHAFGHGSAARMIDSFLTPANAAEQSARPRHEMMIGPAGMMQLAREGYIIIAWDSIGSGERRDYSWLSGEIMDIGADNPLNNVASALGLSKLGLEIWDCMRIIDYACSRPDCDGRFGIAGTSGGGHQSLFAAACDPRILACATSTWFYGFRDALLGLPHNCSCNYVPQLMNAFDCCDIGSLIAPRALHVETGFRDYLSSREIGIGNVLAQYALTQKSYTLLEAAAKLSIYVFDGGHGCNPWDLESPDAPKSGGAFLEFARTMLPIREA